MTLSISPTNLLVNIGALQGQEALHRAESALTISIRNLSSGIRIHTSRDDPVGFVASTAMQRNLTALSQAAANCERDTSLIATVDSALNHVNALLNELRGLVTEAASTGTEVPATLAALQIQADAIIETVNLISATTSFQGQKLLDGSLDFNTYGLDSGVVSQLNIYQANFVGRTEKDIVVQVHEPARQAELYYPYGILKNDTTFTIGGTGGYFSFTFDHDATAEDIANAVNVISDSTGIAATVFSQSNAGSIMLTSHGKNNSVLVTASEPGSAAGNFVFRYTAPREGNEELRVNVAEGDGNNPTVVEIVLETVPGGKVLTTAEQIVTLLNTSELLKNQDGTGRITAAIPTGETGLGTVTPFAEVGYYGCINDNNLLQFLAPAGSPTIKFASTPGTPLSVDDTTYPPIYANAIAHVQGFEQGTSFTVRSLLPGSEGDNVKVIFRDGTNESAEYDPNGKSLTITVNFSGRADDSYGEDFSIEDLKQLLRNNPDVSERFSVIPHTSYLFDDPPRFSSELYRGIDAQLGITSGGIVSQGSLVINLETDENGIIKTTANDLVKFFKNPSTEESAAVLDRWGISVAAVDPSNTNLSACTIGQAGFANGLLSLTYDPNDPCPPNLKYADVWFSSYGNDVREGFATATMTSKEGHNSEWTLTAKDAGAAFNNVSVSTIADNKGPSIQYDPILKMMKININAQNPITAEELVELINSDPELNALFVASLPAHSTGNGIVPSGDKMVLTGGILAINARSEGSITASGGLHSTFIVQSKQATEQFHNTEVLVVADLSGEAPRVAYNPQSKQLTIGIDPNNPPTAQQVVDLINSTSGVSDHFSASLPAFVEGTQIVPNGNGFVSIGDSGILQAQTMGATMGAAMIGATDNQSLGLVFHSVEYGSNEFVEVYATNGELTLVDRFGVVAERANGTNIVANINGRAAIGEGRTAKSTTSDLDIAIATNPDVLADDVFGFRISGGGALMQLGPQATWSHQIRIGIQSVHSTALGGESGTLSQLKTDEKYSLQKDTKTAFRIIEEATIQVTAMRGRLGAIQRAQIEMNMAHMTDAITIETEARSKIADVDFSAESSELARQQLLMQSAVSVLQQSGQMKQLMLSLLQK